MSYFFSNDLPLKADIKRHREKEKELRRLLAEAEQYADEIGSADPFAPIRVAAYKRFLEQLLTSKAQVTSKIGKIQ